MFDHFVGLALKGLNNIDFNRKIQFRTNVLFNPFQPSIAFHIETSDLLCFAKQKIGFYMKCNTDLKYFNTFQYSTINWKKRTEAFADVFRKRCSLKFLNIHRSRRCNVPTQHYLPVQSSNLNTSITLFWCLYCELCTDSMDCIGLSIVDVAQMPTLL